MAEINIIGGDTSFRRTGTSQQARAYSLPGALASLIASNYGDTRLSPTVGTAEQNFLLNLFNRSAGVIPGGLVLKNIYDTDPTAFSGSPELAKMIARDPYATDYEDSTKDLYERSFDKAKSAVQSGPSNVRGATARQGFALSDLGTQESLNRFREIRGQQDKEAGIVQQAVQISNLIENARRGAHLQAQNQQSGAESARTREALGATTGTGAIRKMHLGALATGGEFVGVPRATVLENLVGRGSQTGINANLIPQALALQALMGG